MKDAQRDKYWSDKPSHSDYLCRLAIRVGVKYWDIPGCAEDSITPQDVIKYIKERKQVERSTEENNTV